METKQCKKIIYLSWFDAGQFYPYPSEIHYMIALVPVKQP